MPAFARLRSLMFATLLVAACHPTRGCVESNFTLSPESRLPNWFHSAGVARQDAEVTMDYYVGLVGRTATFTLRARDGRTVASVVGELQGNEPLTLEPHGDTGRIPYPTYEVVTVDEVTEVVEHRRMEPIFYVTDDPQVKQKLGVR